MVYSAACLSVAAVVGVAARRSGADWPLLAGPDGDLWRRLRLPMPTVPGTLARWMWSRSGSGGRVSAGHRWGFGRTPPGHCLSAASAWHKRLPSGAQEMGGHAPNRIFPSLCLQKLVRTTRHGKCLVGSHWPPRGRTAVPTERRPAVGP